MADINVSREGPVLRIQLNRPERRNALTYDVIDQILDALDSEASDDDCRVVVLSGEGNGFCAGDDLKGMGNPTGDRWRGRKAGEAVVPQQTLIRTLRSLPRPVVVSIHGYALGMGLDMALACDLRICDEQAELGDPRSERALYAATGITYQLPRHVGYGRALGMMFLAERISGAEAERIGLVYKSVPGDELDATVEGIVTRLASAATKSIAVIKEQMAVQMDLDYARAASHSVSVRGSYMLEDTAEGITAFLEKRPPSFTGR
jgi:enoyl-CoA hydratase/carnithine racemase|tara:strand:+ start:140 stop:925 length:786 start_codon:yes stop_codon:yes gene_type:complete